MFSLSTSWNSAIRRNGADIVNEIKGIGFDTIELNFALNEAVCAQILSLKESGAIKVSSLHNICPLPEEIEPEVASPDYYSLASPDSEERGLAIDATKNTVRWAARLGAKAVVLHIGRVQVKERTRDLAALAGDKTAFEELRLQMICEREEKKGGYLDNAMKSLGELAPFAKENGIFLGIENRYHFREIPLQDELEIIFKNFPPGTVYYWHDVGHAEAFERLGLAKHKESLERFSNRLLGVHLHDIIGMIGDHRAPGTGTFDFSILKPYIKKETIKVIEAHQPATAADIRRAVKYLTKILG